MKMKTAFLLMLQILLSDAAKINARPAYEVNEQIKTEEKKIQNTQGSLPYGNPLAGNVLQNAKLHAQNQQAMFQAERVRQHRAQLQRWAKQHKPTDSYMRAYHDTQENHQLAIEQQETMINEKKVTITTNKDNRKRMKIPELTKITKEDAITDPEKRRSHRSYGSIEHEGYFQPTKQQNVQISTGPSNEQGIIIIPHGVTNLNTNQPGKLYTGAAENKIQYAYPKDNQIHYQFVEDIGSLNALLKKSPQDQLSGLNAMTRAVDKKKGILETPLNLYNAYIQRTHSSDSDSQVFTQTPQNYANTFTTEYQVKDHTPINEYIDDIEDPNKSTTIRAFGFQNVLTIPEPNEDSSTRSYLNTATQPTQYNFDEDTRIEDNSQIHQPLKEDLKAEQPLYFSEDVNNRNTGEKYLHENDQGVQHLKQDGQEISAYSDENLQYASNYEFGYRVRDETSGSYYGHRELKRDGHTDGHYHVLLPDGRMQKVKYHAGPGGYHADISYDRMK